MLNFNTYKEKVNLNVSQLFTNKISDNYGQTRVSSKKHRQSISYVVLHTTANTAPARNEALNIKNNPGINSFHAVVDENGVVETVKFQEVAHHAGHKWHNCNSIGFELVEKNMDKGYVNLVKYLGYVMAQLNLKPSSQTIKYHHDIVSTSCGGYYKNIGKQKVLQDVTHYYNIAKGSKPTPKPQPKPKPKPKPKPQSNKVTVKKTATHFSTGQKMDNWVKGSTFDVVQKEKTTTLIGRGNSVIGWVRDSDLVGSVSKPQSKIGKYANFKGNVRLFAKSRGDACYHATRNGQNNVYTNVRATSAKILDEDNGRVLVSVPRFNPNKVWIANSESTVSNKPKYRL